MPTLPYNHILKSFPDENRIYQLSWFGALHQNPDATRDALIEVVLTTSSAPDKPRVARVGAGVLPCLHLGTRWLRGRQLPPFAERRQRFADLQISGQLSRITDAASEPELKLGEHHPAARVCPRTKFYVLERTDSDPRRARGSKIIVPCYELIRCYYVNSSQLAKAVLRGGLSTPANDVFDPEETLLPDENGKGFLQLRKWVTDSDRWIVARMAFSAFALNEARNIHASIIKNHHTGCGFTPEARPPFEGVTTWDVCGRWIKPNETWHFLVYWINSCTAPFGYGHLEWDRDNRRGRKSETDEELPPTNCAVPGRRRARTGDDDERPIRDDDEPSEDVVVTDTVLDSERFPDLKDKGDTPVERTKCKSRGRRFRTVEPKPAEGFTTNTGKSGDAVLSPIAIKLDDALSRPAPAETPVAPQPDVDGTDADRAPSRLPAGFDLFAAIVEELPKLGGAERSSPASGAVTCGFVPVRFRTDEDAGDRPAHEHASFFPCWRKNRRIKWAYLDFATKERRQAMIAEVIVGSRSFHLLDVQVREGKESDRYSMSLLFDKGGARLTKDQLMTVLAMYSRHGGRGMGEWEWRNIRREGFKHDLADDEEHSAAAKHARRIYDFIRSR